MENIIIVDCISTGKLFIKDIVKRNYHPIVLEINLNNPDGTPNKIQEKMYKTEYTTIDEDFDIIQEQETYEKTVEMVKGIIHNSNSFLNFLYHYFLCF